MIYININKKIELDKNNMYVVIDFDKTITSFESVDSWAAAAKKDIVPEELIKEMDALYEKYRPIEVDYNISKEEKLKQMETWYSECMDLYYKYDLTKEQITKSIKSSDVQFRKGIKEFLYELYQKNIPVIILSAGIGNTIEQSLKDNNSLYNNMYIISNFIKFDENGKVIKFDNSKMIHSLNKTIKGHLPSEFEEKIKNRKYKLLIGDLIEDIKMVDEKEKDTTLRIGICNKKMGDDKVEIYKENFDIVIEE